MRKSRVILNGKSASNPQVRSAINAVRSEGQPLEVRVTWEAGDGVRFAQEALTDGVDVLIAGGGDGTVNEILNGVLAADPSPTMAMAILPLGSANDFARGCQIPLDPLKALRLATRNDPTLIDVGAANGVFFANVASGGFGAEVTAGTPAGLKRVMGGGAYALVGSVTAAHMTPYQGEVIGGDQQIQGSFIIMAVGNGRQAGGGFPVTPHALIDDGLLDVLFITDFQTSDLGQVFQELQDLSNHNNQFVHYRQVPHFEVEIAGTLPLNLDGEPQRWSHIKFEIVPKCLPLVLPEKCPLLQPK